MATSDAAPALMRDHALLYYYDCHRGLVGFSLLLGGRKFATQYMNLFGIKRYLIALFPLAIIVLVFQWRTASEFLYRSGIIGRVNFRTAMYGVFLLIQTKTHQGIFIYEHEDEGDDDNPHHGKPSAHSSGWHTDAGCSFV